MTYDEMIEVLQAAKSGKTIQAKYHGLDWFDLAKDYRSFDFTWYDYRVKRKPSEGYVHKAYFFGYNPDPNTDHYLHVKEIMP